MGLPVSFKKDLLPYLAFGYGYWFVISYLILYGLAPVLNAFIEETSEKEYRFVLYFYFTAEFIYGFLLDKGHFDYGFSPLAFIGLYLLARYARFYPGKLFSFGKWTDLAQYVWTIFDYALSMKDSVTVIIVCHSITDTDDNGIVFTHIRTNGRKLEKIVLESKLTTVLLAECKDGKYVFHTRADRSSVKTPLGAFEQDEIPNDIAQVLKVLEDY
jgi:hypothetical protein